jgi:hypothetical protein
VEQSAHGLCEGVDGGRRLYNYKWNPEIMTPSVLNMEYKNDKVKGEKVTKKYN